MIRTFVGGAGRSGASCVIVTACPATVIAPERAVVVGATVKLTAPMPDPVAPAVIAIQATALEAVHAQLVPEVTDNV